jgi:hypothetical protein
MLSSPLLTYLVIAHTPATLRAAPLNLFIFLYFTILIGPYAWELRALSIGTLDVLNNLWYNLALDFSLRPHTIYQGL